MAITTTGYSLKRYEDIIAEVRSEMIAASGNPNLDLSDSSLLGLLNNIWALKLSELHELAQAQWSAGDPDTAEGIALDRIVARARISRLQDVKAYGDLQFTGNLGTVINAGTQAKDLAGNVVQTLTQITLSTSAIVGVRLNVTVSNNFTYSVNIDGTTYSFISDSSATSSEIINGLITSLSSNPNLIAGNDAGRLSITSSKDFNITLSAGLAVHNITKSVSSEALVASTEDFEAGVLSYLVNPVGTLTVTNQQKWFTGRLKETDAELRLRFYSSVGGQGNATVEAIFAKLVALSGVQSAVVEENTTLTTDSRGIPAKAIECTVKGGSDVDVATTIWKTKAGGIQAHGNTSYTIVDSQLQDQVIRFTRPVDQYIHVRVFYQLYSEEIFPVNGEDMIARAVKEYGDSLGLDEDVNPQRIMGAIYTSVQGLNNLQVTIGKTASPLDTPIYGSSNIMIGRKEEAIFDLSRIFVSEV